MDETMRMYANRNGLNLNEACVYLGKISRPTLYRLLGQGDLKGYNIGARRYFLISELDSFIARQTGVEAGL